MSGDKKFVTAVLTLSVVLLLTLQVSADVPLNMSGEAEDTEQRSFTYDFGDVHIGKNGGFHTVNMEDAAMTSEEDGPNLPLVKKNIVLPNGKSLADVDVKMKGKELVKEDVHLEDATMNILSSQGSIEPEPVMGYRRYPSENSNYDVQIYRGARVVNLGMVPVEYDAGSDDLYRWDSVEVTITMKDRKSIATNFNVKDRDYLSEFVENPSTLDSYQEDYTIKSSQVEYLIITTSALESSFQDLLDHKTNTMGYTGEIVLKGDITSSYTGSDTQEKIRNCIRDYYQNHGTRYVLLGGDTTDESGNPIIPHRGLYSEVKASNGMSVITINSYEPSDWYYAALDGSFDADGDGTYGEWGDNIDWMREVSIGRLPAQDTTEADAMVDKVIHYETNPVPHKLYEGAQDDSDNIGDLKWIKVGDPGAEGAVDGVNNILPDSYAIESDFESEDGISVSKYEDGIKGTDGGSPFFVNHCGHGSVTEYQLSGSDSYTQSDASSISNSFYPIHYSIACMSGSFDGTQVDDGALLFGGNIDGEKTSDKDCLMEGFLKNADGGISAGMLNSRLGLGGGPNGTMFAGEIDNNLFHAIYDHDFNNLGDVHRWSTEVLSPAYHPNLENHSADSAGSGYKWQLYENNLHGDPAMRVLERDTIYGKVKDENGNPVWNATVDATHEGETLSDITDKSGYFGFSLDDFGSYSNGDDVVIEAVNGTSSGNKTIQIDTGELQQYVEIHLGASSYITREVTLQGPGGSNEGWNFVSINIDANGDNYASDNDLESILEDSEYGISGQYDKVMYYDAPNDDWKTYTPDRANHFNTLRDWDRTMGLWIHLTSDASLQIEGTEPASTTITLQPGWNMVGYPSGQKTTAESSLPSEVTKIGYQYSANEYNLEYTSDLSSIELTPGEGYWLYNDADTDVDWSVTY